MRFISASIYCIQILLRFDVGRVGGEHYRERYVAGY